MTATSQLIRLHFYFKFMFFFTFKCILEICLVLWSLFSMSVPSVPSVTSVPSYFLCPSNSSCLSRLCPIHPICLVMFSMSVPSDLSRVCVQLTLNYHLQVQNGLPGDNYMYRLSHYVLVTAGLVLQLGPGLRLVSALGLSLIDMCPIK